MLTYKKIDRNNYQNKYINGFDSNGKTITIYYNDNCVMLEPYSKEKIRELTDTMRKQFDDATHKYYQYTTDAKVNSNTIIGMHVITGLLGFGAANSPSFKVPTLIALPVIVGIIFHAYKDLIKCLKRKEELEKYKFYKQWAYYINGYQVLSFNGEKDKEGYEPNLITVNELDGYSLQQLKEIVEGINEEYLERGIDTRKLKVW